MAEYDLIIKALSERYMSHIAALVRGVEVHVEQVQPADKETVAVQRTSDVLYKVSEGGYEYIMLVEFQTRPDRNMATRLLALGVMAALKFPKNLITKVLEVSKMENSPLFDGIREEWEAKGITKGIARGRMEGIAEGEVNALLGVLEVKFGKVPDGLRNQLLELRDLGIIRDATRKAVNAKTIDEFTKLLNN